MTLDEIVLENYGPYRTEQRIALTPPSEDRPVVLIGALNGGGKTSLLDALQLALYGRFAVCSGRGSLGYDAFLRRSIHRSADPTAGARLEVQFRYVMEGSEHVYRVHRTWAETGAGIREQVQVFVDGAPDRVLTDTWETHVETFLPRRIAPLFFFDGEKIEAFADPQRSAELLSTAIHSLLGVDVVEQLGTDLIVLERRKRVHSQDAEVEHRRKKARAELEWAHERYEIAPQDRAAAQNDVDRALKRLREVEERFRREGGDLYEQRDRLEGLHLARKRDLRDAESRLHELMSGAAPLFLVRHLLGDVVQQAEREDAIHRAVLLHDLLEERDRELIAQVTVTNPPAEVLASVRRHLEADRERRQAEAAGERYLNLSDEGRQQLHSLLEGELSERGRNDVQEALGWARECQADLDDAERTLSRVPHVDAISGLLEELQDARATQEKALARLAALDEGLRLAAQEREARSKRSEQEDNASADHRFQAESSSRIVTHSRRVRETLERFRVAMVHRHIHRIEQFILASLRQLLRKERLVDGLTIDPETYSVSLKTPDGKLLTPDRLSAGERQLLAVAILWGLARASGRKLPVVIDTPLGRLDSAHRANLLQRYFPAAGHQVVLLSTDMEIDARGRSILQPYVGLEHTLLFDEAIGSTVVEQGYLWAEDEVHAN